MPNVLVQESFQSTPAFVLSPSTIATRLAVSPVSAAPSVNDAGDTVTEIGGAGEIVICALTVAVGALIEAAVIVTAPDGGVAGAVYMVVGPSAELSVPHAPVVVDAHATVHEAPALAGSFFTSTPSVTLPDTCKDAGGVDVNSIEIDGWIMVTVKLLVAEGLLVADAAIITVPPIGTSDGAV